MSNTKHTPGPWNVTSGIHDKTTELYDKGETWFCVNGPGGIIAEAFHGRCLSADEGEALANAKLIAAAPDLLEICQRILSSEPLPKHIEQDLEQAIKKATE